jgi:hypothetical protein
MRRLSLWAKYNAVYARIIIVISHCILIWIAYFLGTQLSQSGVELSPLWIYFLIAVFFITGALYPSAKSSKNYLKRKFCDSIVVACGFLLTICVVTNLNKATSIYQTAEAVNPVNPSLYKYAEAKKLLEQFKNGEKTKFTLKEKRIIKKEFKYQVFQYAKAKLTGNKKGQDDAAAIVLVCIAAAGLFVLLIGLACNLSCNGSEAAAWIVFILGTVAIVWGSVAIIHSIQRKRSKSKAKPSQ